MLKHSRRKRTQVSDRSVRRALILFGSATRAEARGGLVYGPYLNEARPASIATARGGACTKLRRHYIRQRQQPPPRRGLVRDFSRRSRTRLQQMLCAIPVDRVGSGMLFVTLTYPAAFPGEWRVWKGHLHHFAVTLRRKLPAAAAVWKLEPQRRGAPHFHLVVVGVPFMAKEWLSRTWYEVVGSHDPKHLAAGTNVQAVHSHRGVVSYAAKYTAKHQELPDDWQGGVGRWWGVLNRDGLGIVWRWAYLSQAEYWQACRIVRRLVGHRQRAVGRAPPRSCSAGMWAVLRHYQALRLLRCLVAAR